MQHVRVTLKEPRLSAASVAGKTGVLKEKGDVGIAAAVDDDEAGAIVAGVTNDDAKADKLGAAEVEEAEEAEAG